MDKFNPILTRPRSLSVAFGKISSNLPKLFNVMGLFGRLGLANLTSPFDNNIILSVPLLATFFKELTDISLIYIT